MSNSLLLQNDSTFEKIEKYKAASKNTEENVVRTALNYHSCLSRETQA